MIEVSGIRFGYPNKPLIFDDFSWVTKPGESWAVLGASGCGKSTLLYLLAGLRFPQSGVIKISGEVLHRPRPHTSLILQDYGLLPWATVAENIALGLRIRQFYGPDGKHAPEGAILEKVEQTVAYWIGRVGLIEVEDQFPGQISGGQRQRTAIARSLALTPDLLLMDEPFASLDTLTREGLQKLILQLRRESNLTTVTVTHSIEEAALLGEKILVMGSPPQKRCTTIDNPDSGEVDFAGSPSYNTTCSQLRAVMEDLR
ncbi:MAG TPA: ATP-binding cassette domain-containing protein [Anaerolineaceae bacterium]